ncbi:MAG: YafY family transcriptional regulator [Acidimicrobiales bacterium]|nr:YafY family transcriptional regulator [Acidimicrobiales bacterium]
MRADRLVAVLLFMQARGKVTAAQVAEHCETSVKTARRDLEALSIAGIPVYPERGRNGGWQLLGGARTDLTGLRSDEANALFFAMAEQSSQTPALRSAMAKLADALPDPLRSGAERAKDSVIVDPFRWNAPDPLPENPALGLIQKAIVNECKIVLRYHDAKGDETERTVEPMGLVTKVGVWYLVALTPGGRRTFRVSRVVDCRLTDEPVVRPEGFDLGSEWDQSRTAFGDSLRHVSAEIIAESDAIRVLRFIFRGRLQLLSGPVAGDRCRLRVEGANAYQIAVQLAGLVGSVEVVSPESVRKELASIGRQLREVYPS